VQEVNQKEPSMSEISQVLRASDYLVVDNAFPEEVYNYIKTHFEHKPRKYSPETNFHELRKDVTKEHLLQDYGFTNIITGPDGSDWQEGHDAFETCIKQYFDVEKIWRIKAGLFTPAESEFVHWPHVDIHDVHWTALFYFSTEKDHGQTYIWNQKFDPYIWKNPYEQYDATKDKFEALEKVETKENRVLFFKGNVFHSSSRPRTVFKRIAVNVNFRGVPLLPDQDADT